MPGRGEFGPAALTDVERFDWLRLTRSETIGPKTFRKLLERYGSAGAALNALPDLIRQGKPGRPIRIFSLEETEMELEAMQRLGAFFLGFGEPDYPALLRRIDSPPPLLAIRGDRTCLRRSKVAIVGSRNASVAGLAFTDQIARGLAREGYAIVSGLARGIDARAHQASISTGTIAVLASGLGAVYPAEHEGLVERLIERGAVISEMPFSWEPRGRDFPRRNRIVSGVSLGVVVVEATRGSGSLWTAKFAAEQGREVFAVPGSPLDPRAEGTNDLLRDGATFCTSAEDVIEALAKRGATDERRRPGFSEGGPSDNELEALWDELDVQSEDIASPERGAFSLDNDLRLPLEEDEATGPVAAAALLEGRPTELPLEELTQRVTELLGPTPVSVDELVRAARAQARDVRVVLFELERAGKLERHGGDLVSLVG